MRAVSVNLNTENKGYLDEKELYILFHLLQKKYISTWDNAFSPNGQSIHIPSNTDPNKKLTEIEENIKKTIENTQRKKQSASTLNYLLELGQEIDPKGFQLFCDADYALVDGGFLYDDDNHSLMWEYFQYILSESKKEPDKKFETLTEEQKKAVNDCLLEENLKDGKVQFPSSLAYQPIKEYKEAILNKKADEDFIELVNKLVKEYDGGGWNTEDAKKFLEIYYRHNKQKFRENALTEKTVFYEDWQTRLAGLIFEHIHIRLKISDTEKLEKYLTEYIGLFRNDGLNGVSNFGLTKSFFSSGLSVPFHTKLFGYKKQREILIEHIEKKYADYQRNDLEIGSPFVEPEYIGDADDNTFQLKVSDKDEILFRLVHTIIALFYENYLVIEDFSYGTTQLFDMYDRGFLFKVKVNKNTETVSAIATKTPKSKPFLVTEKRKGYLKFTKNGEKIFIGSIGTRKFRLLKALIEPSDTIGTARNLDTVFEAIQLPKDKSNSKLSDSYLKKNEQVSIIEYTIKELQKVRKLQGKLHFSFGDNKKKLWLEVY